MGEISDISFHTLVSASDNFIRPETLREANDRISNAIAKLPIFRHYDLGDALHSSSDGQKFETSIHTLNSRRRQDGVRTALCQLGQDAGFLESSRPSCISS
jgi:TnpA family transposase